MASIFGSHSLLLPELRGKGESRHFCRVTAHRAPYLLELKDNGVSNKELIAVNKAIRSTGIEAIGAKLRGYTSAMKAII